MVLDFNIPASVFLQPDHTSESRIRLATIISLTVFKESRLLSP